MRTNWCNCHQWPGRKNDQMNRNEICQFPCCVARDCYCLDLCTCDKHEVAA